jgi:hypothetical protein
LNPLIRAAALAAFAFSPAMLANPSPTPTATPAVTPAPARPTPTPAKPAQARPTPGKPAPQAASKPKQQQDEWNETRRMFEQLSPDQQKRFLDNLDQWKTMSPEEQELFRDQDLIRREKIALEIQDAINKSGLKLDEDQREVYALRYTQERRKIEEELRKEMDQKRNGMVSEMLSRLKIEFAATPTPNGKNNPGQAKPK